MDVRLPAEPVDPPPRSPLLGIGSVSSARFTGIDDGVNVDDDDDQRGDSDRNGADPRG